MSKHDVSAHPTIEVIAAFIDGRLSAGERADVVAHLAGCRDCRETLAAFAHGHDVSPAPAARSSFMPKARVWLALAATLAVVTTAGVVIRRLPAPPLLAPAPAVSAPEPPAPDPADRATPPQPPLTPPSTTPASPPAEDLTIRRSAVRQIGDKTFRLEAGEWVDATYDPLGMMPIEPVPSGARAALLARIPDLAPFAALGPRVLVVHQGIVYRFGSE